MILIMKNKMAKIEVIIPAFLSDSHIENIKIL